MTTQAKPPVRKFFPAFIVSLLISALSFAIVALVTKEIACAIVRPVYIDPESGNEVPMVPVNQIAFGMVFGLIAGIIVFIKAFKYFRKSVATKPEV